MMSDTLLVVVRGLVYVDLLTLFGLALFGLYGLGAAEEAIETLRLRRRCAWLAIGGLAISSLHSGAMAAAMSGADSVRGLFHATVMLLTMHGMGSALIMRMVTLALVLPSCLVLPSQPRSALSAIVALSGVAVATMAWAGHGAMGSEAGWGHLVSDIAHLLGAGGWVGALVALLTLLFERAALPDAARIARLARALRSFSFMGTVFVSTILLTGIVNIASIVGWSRIGALPQSIYGKLLIAKLLLFVFMLGLAASNRFWLSSALARAQSKPERYRALTALRFSIGIETLLALGILSLVAALGLLAPAR